MNFLLKTVFLCVLAVFCVSAANVEVADKPEEPAQYSFEYHINNPETGDIKSQHEVSDGNAVHGMYGLVEPDGNVRTVEYSADDQNGFRAVVHNSGGPAAVAGPTKLLSAELPESAPPSAELESATNDLPGLPDVSELTPPAGESATTPRPGELPPSAVVVTPKSIASPSPLLSSTALPSSTVSPLAQYAYLNPYYKYSHPWTLHNLYKTHPAYRYPYLDPAHPAHPAHPANPANPLSPLHPANLANPFSPLHPANPLSPYSRALIRPVPALYAAADPLSPAHPAHPANPLSPLNPAHPANLLHPAHPANPLNPLNPAHPLNPLSPYNPYNALYQG